MDQTEQTIWILHLSDFHTRSSGNQDLENRIKAIRQDWSSVAQEIPPDLILISGDIAYQGLAGEYEQAESLIQVLCEDFKYDFLQERRIYIAPGNHDMMRDAGKTDDPSLDQELLHLPSQKKVVIPSRTIGQPPKPVLLSKTHPCFIEGGDDASGYSRWYENEDNWKSGIDSRFSNFHNWIEKRFKHQLTKRVADGKGILIPFPDKDVRVFLGLVNTAIASTGYSDDNRPHFVSGAQINNVLSNYPQARLGKEDNELLVSIALMHHPFHLFPETEQGSDSVGLQLFRKFQLILCGHVHRLKIDSLIRPYSKTMVVASRALGDPDGRDSHGYNIIRIELPQLDIKVYPRRWSFNSIYHTDYDWIKDKSEPMFYPSEMDKQQTTQQQPDSPQLLVVQDAIPTSIDPQDMLTMLGKAKRNAKNDEEKNAITALSQKLVSEGHTEELEKEILNAINRFGA